MHIPKSGKLVSLNKEFLVNCEYAVNNKIKFFDYSSDHQLSQVELRDSDIIIYLSSRDRYSFFLKKSYFSKVSKIHFLTHLKEIDQ